MELLSILRHLFEMRQKKKNKQTTASTNPTRTVYQARKPFTFLMHFHPEVIYRAFLGSLPLGLLCLETTGTLYSPSQVSALHRICSFPEIIAAARLPAAYTELPPLSNLALLFVRGRKKPLALAL